MRLLLTFALSLPMMGQSGVTQPTIQGGGSGDRGTMNLAQWQSNVWLTERKTAERTVEIPGHYYVVRYEYSSGMASVPPTCPSGRPHYDATIEVFEVLDGSKIQIGRAFPGQYVEGGCFEDKPEMLVKKALKLVLRLTPEIEAAFDERDRKAAFEAMPLFENLDMVLTITGKGMRDLKKIVVDGKTVWERKP